MMESIVVAAYVVAVSLASLRWLRVAQREHYEPGRVTLFASRWWTSSTTDRALGAAAVVGAVAAAVVGGWPGVVLAGVTFLVISAAPLGLGLRGASAPLRWTRRMTVVAGFAGAVVAIVVVVALVTSIWILPVLALAQPVVVDLALALDRPVERLLSARYLRDAEARLRRVAPEVVGITGSYGKTTVKNYTAHLLGRSRKTIASRKSFNNRLGLAMSINNDLEPGTEYFIAEMGTYGVGEIAEMCRWTRPNIAAITAIGPVHLERMGSLDTIATAKSEILEHASTVVLNVDNDRLRDLADRSEREGKRVVRCSATRDDVDVMVSLTDDELTIRMEDRTHRLPVPASGLVPINLATSLGICLAAGAVPPRMEEAVAGLPPLDNRLAVTAVDDGPTLIDDTYNSNPAGAAVALERLESLAAASGGRMIVVSPGMVELGDRQAEENGRLAAQIAERGALLVVVGLTNRSALVDGYASAAQHRPIRVRNRADAVAWIREEAKPQDVVLFENDLPDHYP